MPRGEKGMREFLIQIARSVQEKLQTREERKRESRPNPSDFRQSFSLRGKPGNPGDQVVGGHWPPKIIGNAQSGYAANFYTRIHDKKAGSGSKSWIQPSVPRANWQVRPELNVRHLSPPVVLCALFDFDPRPIYRENLENLSDKRTSSPPVSIPSGAALSHRWSQIASCWDMTFRDIAGDQVYLLCDYRTEEGDEVNPGFILSDSTEEVNWLTTRLVRHATKPICWCIPLEAHQGETIRVILDEGNVYNLEEEYLQVFGKRS